jgi:putative endonuclease
MPNGKRSFGKWGENKAACFLREKGFQILEQNLRYSFAEVDIIAQKNNILFFCEVKARNSSRYGEGWESVGERKIQRIQKAAETYIVDRNYSDKDVRIAVISILRTGGKETIRFLPV